VEWLGGIQLDLKGTKRKFGDCGAPFQLHGAGQENPRSSLFCY
jgi:hypothetical protein